MEQFRELYWEALRAPDDFVTLNRNPYRRETITKKLLGKTKEERAINKAELDALLESNKQEVDKKLAEAEIYQRDVVDKKNAQRRAEISQKRQKLGYLTHLVMRVHSLLPWQSYLYLLSSHDVGALPLNLFPANHQRTSTLL